MSKKIHFLIRGGLGNQLFQYAAGLYAEKRWGVTVYFHVVVPKEDHGQHPRKFMLNQFMLSKPMHHLSWVVRRSLYGSKLPRLKNLIHRGLGVQVHDESHFYAMDPLMKGCPDERCAYLRGYWQCKDYVEEVADSLREEFRFREVAVGDNAEMLSRIHSEACPISVHIRRGDYQQIAGGSIVLPATYYQKAIERMIQKFPQNRFFVFSDDLEWARATLPQEAPLVFVDGNSQNAAHEDLRLMSACKHHIIANSSFSWWGAWLNPNPEKAVVVPKYWMGNEMTPSGLIPEGWGTLWENE